MSEYANITVQRYRTPTGAPTCARSIDRTCQFMTRVSLRGIETCGARRGSYINRKDGEIGAPGIGYTIPLPDCPVWADEDAK